MSQENRARLSDVQRKVVDFADGALLVVAGPGSGKTRVLTERVRRLLLQSSGRFRVLALTFTNKAANEMKDRLDDVPDIQQRAFIGTLHGFCLDVLSDKGGIVGVESSPQIFEQYHDRRQILLQAINEDPVLLGEIEYLEEKQRDQRVDSWLREISNLKSHPLSLTPGEDALMGRIYEAYNAGLRACGAYDFDDLLLLTYKLFSEYPKAAAFYRRLYQYVCIDEAQDLNEAQYAVIRALCSDGFRNLMMVGDPKQSIYGFNTSSPKYMELFKEEFGAEVIELKENFRSSREIVRVARSLDPNYLVEAQLPVPGEIAVYSGMDERDEARVVADKIEELIRDGHPDIEGEVVPSSFAVLGRTRFSLIPFERELESRGIPFYKRFSSSHESESDIFEDFLLALRVYANPLDSLHFSNLMKRWRVGHSANSKFDIDQSALSDVLSNAAMGVGLPRGAYVAEAIRVLSAQFSRINLMPALQVLERYSDEIAQDERQAVYEDSAVLRGEWDRYLRSEVSGSPTISGFMSSMALGVGRKSTEKGVALLTVHASKGLEFDIVFLVCMVDGVFPDYRAKGKRKEEEEERRNVFVAVTRSKRLLYLSYPRQRLMPWGDMKQQYPSPYLRAVGN